MFFFIMTGVCQNGPFVFQRIRDHDGFSDGSELAHEQCPILLKWKVKWKAVCVVPRKCISVSSVSECSLGYICQLYVEVFLSNGMLLWRSAGFNFLGLNKIKPNQLAQALLKQSRATLLATTIRGVPFLMSCLYFFSSRYSLRLDIQVSTWEDLLIL